MKSDGRDGASRAATVVARGQLLRDAPDRARPPDEAEAEEEGS